VPRPAAAVRPRSLSRRNVVVHNSDNVERREQEEATDDNVSPVDTALVPPASGGQYLGTTNDDQEGIADAEEKLVDGYLDVYSCIRVAGDVQLETVLVEYDYEYVAVEVGGGANSNKGWMVEQNPGIERLPPTLPAMEWGLLWTVSHSMGLHGCHFTVQNIPPSPGWQTTTNDHWNGTRRSLQLEGIQSLSVAVSLSSLPTDQYDPTVCKS